ncbi:MAG: cation:proton antiporter, partial [Clostridia bacterium]|nr:cation:proton antiporter [Clostridia bacterium]
MLNYKFLLALALILLFTKLFGLITEKVHLPQVVGALIAGIVLGPSCFGILEDSDFLIKTAEIGVIMLMF